jgi:hypothetical protein
MLIMLSPFLALAWFNAVDQIIRFSQPFANTYNKLASASDSILLDYLWGPPVLTTFRAIINRHYKVAWFSLINLASPTFPILVVGMLTATTDGERIYISISPVIFYLIFTSLLYILPLYRWRGHVEIVDY